VNVALSGDDELKERWKRPARVLKDVDEICSKRIFRIGKAY